MNLVAFYPTGLYEKIIHYQVLYKIFIKQVINKFSIQKPVWFWQYAWDYYGTIACNPIHHESRHTKGQGEFFYKCSTCGSHYFVFALDGGFYGEIQKSTSMASFELTGSVSTNNVAAFYQEI